MRNLKAILSGFSILGLVAAGLYISLLDKSPAKTEDQGEADAGTSIAAAPPDQKVKASPLPVKGYPRPSSETWS